MFKFLFKRKKSAKDTRLPVKGKRINLLIEVGSFDKGGLEKLVLDMATSLDKERFQVSIVSMGPVGFLGKRAIEQDISVFELSGPMRKRLYKSILRDQKIHLSNSHFSHYGYPLFKEMGIPNVTFIHNVYAFLNKGQLTTFTQSDRYVDRYVAVSKNAARYAVGRLGIARGKIVVIPNGLNIEEYQRRKNTAPTIARSDFGVSEHDYLFLNVASYNLHKGHYLMADAMKKVLTLRDDIKVLCIGSPVFPPHVEGFRDYLREEGLNKHILMPGFYPNVESFYEMADAFLQPSFIEGWSIAMNEAMFFGKPMILTDTGAAPEVIEENDIGILIENEYGDILNLDSMLLDSMAYNQRSYRTSAMLSQAMMEFADNREHWRAAGMKGRQKLIQRYDMRKILKQYERLFLEMTGGEN